MHTCVLLIGDASGLCMYGCLHEMIHVHRGDKEIQGIFISRSNILN